MRDVRKYARLLPESFKLLHTSLAPNELFYLVNNDLGFHNIFINNDWKIIAVIDLDCVSLAPLSWALKPPIISMMEVKPGSMIFSHPIQRMEDIRCNESYRLWLLELQSTFKRQGNLTQLKQIKRFIFLGGRELVLSITAFQDFDLAAGSVWFQAYQRIAMGLSPKYFARAPFSLQMSNEIAVSWDSMSNY